MGEEIPLEGAATLPYDPSKALPLKPIWARFLIVFAGPGMNLVLAAVIFAIVLATVGRPVWPAMIGRVTEGSPAAAAGLQTGDVVKAADGVRLGNWEDLDRVIASSAGRPLQLRVARSGVERDVSATPRHATFRDPIFKEPKETWDPGVGPQLR